ncbi:5'-methylthioadenosine/adenosylhomocysteine nucleosidase [Clostridium estertheticum]|uniref:adenosylhomocysteine nucleosidase n=1 Tax=Clostridium estertheticum TaxID=238834 RepID=A0A7Y3SSU3_9CLOT|nr:5'-methylthioadenosine/adenosylhomocysteine nucleosidase [Clostridium estertheticum]MCB2353430.1 5'-methylthioadenosine/adenosylhomocysteine nucleosidase [Clostridium estertheticum]NNU74705.1 5'-methylthioadenosine/adenosylhomocysteine nucleosidase [Clostridium estertheticum]WAG41773.1 5'-methylthioadenosine/adenosylhomocysteine nucleosidase [Clostridium estertheticum]WBL47172.1 5'-methylthioadenosine/adenosylhomocysteine nucleosidase [Clostridium estertheticum]
MRIGVLGPTEREIMPFINKILNKKIREHAMLKFYSGIYEDVEVVSAFCGVCKVNAAIATQILISKFEVTHIVLTGVAGALNRELGIGDTVISNEVAYHDVANGILTEYHPWMKDIYFRSDVELLNICEDISKDLSGTSKFHFGRIITGEAFVERNEREGLIENFNPLCVDMESASVAHTCYVNNIPFIVIRSMSDNADENALETFESNIEMAALNSTKLVEKLIKKLGETEHSNKFDTKA